MKFYELDIHHINFAAIVNNLNHTNHEGKMFPHSV